MLDDIRGYKGLISAIITRAILDSLVQPASKGERLTSVARSGLNFLLGKNVGVYLDFLNIDCDYFQKHLIESMFDDKDDPSFNATKKRMFRLNYKKYIQENNKKLLIMSTYKAKRK